MSVLSKSPSGKLIYTFDWSKAVTTDAVLQSVDYEVPADIELDDQGVAAGESISTIEISGGKHGRTYSIKATATLSSDEEVPDTLTLRVFETG